MGLQIDDKAEKEKRYGRLNFSYDREPTGIKTYFGVICINEGYGLHREIMMKLFIEIFGSIFKKNKF